MKHKEALYVRGIFGQPFQSVHRNLRREMLSGNIEEKKHLYLLLPNGVVAPGVVVGSVLLASDQLLRVKELPVGSSPNLFQVYFYCIVSTKT